MERAWACWNVGRQTRSALWCVFSLSLLHRAVSQQSECAGDVTRERLFVPLVVWFFVTLAVACAGGVVVLVPTWRAACRGKASAATAAAASGVGGDKGPEEDDDGGIGELGDSWRISARRLRFGKRIGIGNVGEVYRGTYKGAAVAIKKLLSSWVSDADMVARFKDEILLMASMNHANVLRFVGAVVDEDVGNICLVTELCERGTLHDLLHSDEPLPWPRRVKLARDIACGMDYLHTHLRIIQRDLKTANLLVTKNYDVKIAGELTGDGAQLTGLVPSSAGWRDRAGWGAELKRATCG